MEENPFAHPPLNDYWETELNPHAFPSTCDGPLQFLSIMGGKATINNLLISAKLKHESLKEPQAMRM